MRSHWAWRNVLPHFSTGAQAREVIALDLPGYGESDRPAPSRFSYSFEATADVIAEVLAALDVAPAVIIGFSMGSAVAAALVARHPERALGLILGAPSGLPQPIVHSPAAQLLRLPGLGRLLWRAGQTPAIIRYFMERDFYRDPSAVSDEHIDYYRARVTRPGGLDAAYASFQALSALGPVNPHYAHIHVPTWVIAGEEDRVVPLSLCKQVAAGIAGAQLALVPATGHEINVERPEELARTIARCIEAMGVDRAPHTQAEAS